MMMMKRIACIAHGPASANALLPLIQRFQQDETCALDLYAFHPYVAMAWSCEEQTKDRYEGLFTKQYDVIFYGTGSCHEIECMVPYYAKQVGSTTISILDTYWSSVENLRMRYQNPPDFLIVPNETVRNEIIDARIMTPESVFAFGNPHFDRLTPYVTNITSIVPPYDLVVFSQPSATSDFSTTALSVQVCLHSLAKIQQTTSFIQAVTVTSHPREDSTWLANFCAKHQWTCTTHDRSFDLLLSTDLSIGVNCTLQYEAQLIGKPTIFFTTEESLFKSFHTASFLTSDAPHLPTNATDTIYEWMKEYTSRKRTL